ncbi:MAG: DUF1016 family protein [Muribaculaceae bacterium]|nr:DUF1016 family protein [Muribaculaceae bacterium]
MNSDNENILSQSVSAEEYVAWRSLIVSRIEQSKLKAIFNVNAELLSLYWSIGNEILQKQTKYGWGAQVIDNLSHDLSVRFPDDRGYSIRNLKYMRQFAQSYPDFPIVQVPLAQLEGIRVWNLALSRLRAEGGEFVQVPLAQITWYHHISLLSKVKNLAQRAFYIAETVKNGWSRDVMLMQISNGYIDAIGNAVNNFDVALPSPISDLAKYTFKDPYNFSFLGTVALQNELSIEKELASRVTDFLLEMGRGFAFVGRQYHIEVGNDDYYIDILMYNLKLHCYVVVELKSVEFRPEFVSKLNFYISAIDEKVKQQEDKPTIGLLLCRSKSNEKARFALRGITQPLGIAEYETQQLFAEVASSLPQMESDIVDSVIDEEVSHDDK